jgi:hypothetical protein
MSSEPQPAAALREVDEVTARADQPAARISDQEGAATELNASIAPSFESSRRFHAFVYRHIVGVSQDGFPATLASMLRR